MERGSALVSNSCQLAFTVEYQLSEDHLILGDGTRKSAFGGRHREQSHLAPLRLTSTGRYPSHPSWTV